MWVKSGACHCNSHKRCDFWNSQRNSGLLGGLQPFNLTLSEVDAHLRQAGTRSRAETDVHIWGNLNLLLLFLITRHFTATVFFLFRDHAPQLQARALRTVCNLPEGKDVAGIWFEPSAPARPHLWVSHTADVFKISGDKNSCPPSEDLTLVISYMFCSYSHVYEFVSSFLNQADKLNGRAAAILRLGAAEQFIRHFQSSG